MADIFQEVEEEVRKEQLKKLWDRYGVYAVALAVLAVVAVAGWRGYESWQTQKAAEAGAAFDQAVALVEEGKHQEAEAAFTKLATEGTAGYRNLARLREAAELAQRDAKAGVAAYDAIASDAGFTESFKELASLRAGLLLVDGASLDELRRRIEPLAGPSAVFRHSARELLALAAWRANDMAEARRWSELIMADPETPSALRARIAVLVALLPAQARS